MSMKLLSFAILFCYLFTSYGSDFGGGGILGTDALSMDEVCGIEEVPGEMIQYGGKYLPSQGTIRALVVFIKFPDDQLVSSNWPIDATLPSYANHYIDDQILYIPTPKSITDYFHVMSNGTFHLIGDIYPSVITTQHTRQW